MLGCGVVGTEVARVLTTDAEELGRRVGAPVELVGIAVRRIERTRDLDLDPNLFTTDAQVTEVIEAVSPLFVGQGYTESTSAGPFAAT